MTNPIVAISLSSRLMPLASASPSPSPSAPVFPSAQDRLQSRTRAVVVAPRWHMAELSLRRLNPVWHGAVSCSRSSNRTGAFRATALGERSRGRPRKAARPPGEAKLVTHGGFRKLPPAAFQLRWNSRPDTGRRKSAFVARAVRVRFDHAVEKQFLKPENRALVLAQDRPADLLPALEEWRPTHIEKWLSRDARSIGQSARCSQRRGESSVLLWPWEKYAAAGRRGTEPAFNFSGLPNERSRWPSNVSKICAKSWWFVELFFREKPPQRAQ